MKDEELPDEVHLDREIGQRTLIDFTEMAWPHVEPGQPFINSWHLGLLSEHYEACLRGEIRRLVVNVPPGMSKSRLTCVFLPTYAWILNPGLRFMFLSFDQQLTYGHASDSIGLMQEKWFRERWGHRFVIPGNPPQSLIENNMGGWRFASSVGGKATGRHGDIQVIDDPIKPKEVTKDSLLKSKSWLQNTMASRWRKPGLECRILIMQRLHMDDLSQHMIDEGAVHVCLPMNFNPTVRCFTKWGEDPRTEPGELLCPERFDEETVNTIRGDMDTYVAAAQLDQSPVPEGGGIFRSEWLQFWTQLPERFDSLIMSWDAAFKGVDTSDFVVGQLWGRRKGEFFLIDQVRGRWTFTETLAQIRKFAKRHPKAITKLIEDKANGSAIIDTLQKEIPGIVAVNPEGGKESRANSIQGLFESMSVYLPNQPWVKEYITELTSFPFGKFDDQVDCTSQALLHLHQRRSYLQEAMKRLNKEWEEE